MARVRSLFLAVAVLGLASAANAAHHQWIISELFSNADGTVQFVELVGRDGVVAPGRDFVAEASRVDRPADRKSSTCV